MTVYAINLYGINRHYDFLLKLCLRLTGAYAFVSSSFSAQQLACFECLPTISRIRIAPLFGFPLSRQAFSSSYVATRALTLLFRLASTSRPLPYSTIFLSGINRHYGFLLKLCLRLTGRLGFCCFYINF